MQHMLIFIQTNLILIRHYNNDVPDILFAQLNRLYCCIKIVCMVNTMCLVTSARPYTSGISRTYGLVDDSFRPAQALRDAGTSHWQQTAVANSLTTLLRLSTTVPTGSITGRVNKTKVMQNMKGSSHETRLATSIHLPFGSAIWEVVESYSVLDWLTVD